VIKGITAENLSQDTLQPELMYRQVCEYLNMMKEVCSVEE
jgi:hypothetical protein